jgi:GxxExxY protein
MTDILYKQESYEIMGACFNVYNEKGNGFLDPVYQDCMDIELNFQKIPFLAQPILDLFYRDIKLKHFYEPDFICYEKIVLERKAAEHLTKEHYAQVFNYLKATGLKLGIIVNFGHYPDLEYKRIVI